MADEGVLTLDGNLGLGTGLGDHVLAILYEGGLHHRAGPCAALLLRVALLLGHGTALLLGNLLHGGVALRDGSGGALLLRDGLYQGFALRDGSGGALLLLPRPGHWKLSR